MAWHLPFLLLLDQRQGVKEGQRRIGLGRRGQVEGGFRQVEAALGQPHPIKCLGAGDHHPDCVGLSQAHVLAGKDQHPPEDKAGVLTGIDHLGQPIERRIGIRAAQRFDKGADGIIVIVAILVIEHRPALDALLGHAHVHDNDAILVGRGGLYGQFQGIEHTTGIAVGYVHQVGESIIMDVDLQPAIAAVRIGHGVAGNGAEIIVAQRPELKDTAPADKRPVDAEIGVLCGRADENDGAILHPGQKGILLGLVPAVHLIHKEDRPLVIQGAPLLGLFGHPPDIGHAGQHGVQSLKVTAGRVGNDGRQRGLAGAGRPVKDDRRELVGLDGPPQQAARPDDVLLADELVQGLGAHTSGQWRLPFYLFLAGLVKQVHACIVPEDKVSVNCQRCQACPKENRPGQD